MKYNMRIFIDTRALNSKSPSGIPEYVRLLIKHLLGADKGNEFLFFTNSFRKFSGPAMFKTGKIQLINYHVPNRALDLSAKFFDVPEIDKLVTADVFYSPSLNILSFNDSSKHVLTVHDLSFVHHPEFFGWREKAWHWRQNYENQIKKAGLIVAVSEFTKCDVIETFKVPADRVVRIHSGVNPFYRPIPVRKFKDPFMLYLGRVEPRKNLAGLIRAFNLLKRKNQFQNLKLYVAGGCGWLYDKILKEAADSPCFSDIRFLGPVSRNQALRLYNTASVFVYPSFFEGFGFPPLEAQACGLPVVASNKTSLPEILGDSAVLVDPSDVEALAGVMEKVITDESLQKELKNKGFENVKRFNWTRTAQELLQCLKSFR